MKLLHAQNRINELMSRFVSQIEMEAAMSRTGLNKAAETILIPLLNEVYGWSLKNINYAEENNNYPSIDLADEVARISVQVTATPNLEKVKHTLEQFTKHNQYLKYDRLIIYVLKKKQDSYSKTATQGIIQNKFRFDSQKDIWDYRDIIKEISNFQIDRALRIQEILEANFGEDQRLRSLLANNLEQSIDWRETCRGMLDRQKKLSTNEVIASEAMQFDLLDDKIFVSLALVERKEPDRLSRDIHPARSVERYEEEPPIEYEAFREQVLGRGESDRIAIVGEPGAGKTTLLQHIAFWILEKRLGLPIWISLGDLIKSGELQRLKDYLTQVWLEDAIPNVTEEVKSGFLNQLDHQRVWLLLDGADEIVASSGIALREIHDQLGSWLRQSSIVLTCRINVWDADINALRDFQTYRTKEFRYPTQVEQFIENGFRRSNRSSGERLKTELAKTEHVRLQQLVRNPLRLMMLCTTWHEQECLPATKAELYGRFVDEFYKWNKIKWKKKDLNYALFPNKKAEQEKLNQALGRLACRALDEKAAPFRLPHNLVFDELGDPEDDSSDFWLALNLGWLQIAKNSDKPSEKVYTFFHPTFQEYFAALAITHWDYFLPYSHKGKPIKTHEGECKYRIFDSQWREVILLWVGDLDKPGAKTDRIELIKKLVDFEDGVGGFYWFQANFLIAEMISEFNDQNNTNCVLDRLIEWSFGKDTKDPEQEECLEPVIRAAINALKLTHSNTTIDFLINRFPISQLHQIDQDKGCAIAEIIGQIGISDSRGVEILITLLTSKYWLTQSKASQILIELGRGNQEVINGLKESLTTIKNPYLCILAAKTLAGVELDKQYGNTTLIRLMSSSNDEEVRLLAAQSLLEIYAHSEAGISTVIEIKRVTKNEWNLFRTIETLDSLKDCNLGINKTNIVESLHEPLAIKPKLAKDDEKFMHEVRRAKEISAEIKDIDNIDTLKHLFISCNERGFRSQLTLKIVRLARNKLAYVNIIADLTDEAEDEEIFEFVAWILGRTRIKNERIARTLIQILKASQRYLTLKETVDSLKILLHGQLFEIAVSELKDCLTLKIYDGNPQKYSASYEVVWHCAQNMSYLDFYRAWHSSSSANAELSTDD